jgi:predicted nucleotide-binding protein
MEIGFLLGALGRGRVVVLQAEGDEDGLGGVTRHPMDGAGLWRLLLAREMKQAGLKIDLNRAV